MREAVLTARFPIGYHLCDLRDADMAVAQAYAFGPFQLDLEAGALRREGEELPLTPKGFALLRYLVERPGRLVSREELLDAVWPATYVGDEALKVRIRELRRALGDPAGTPLFIATAHRRGYRFVAEVRRMAAGDSEAAAEVAGAASAAASPIGTVAPPPGRERELARLEAALARALAGERQVVFVSGDPGIGKTTLVEAFLAAHAGQALCVARGQCLELHGAGEGYLPWLDALGRLAGGATGALLVAVLRERAPSWLGQLPWLLSPEERSAVARESAGTRERMLRELAEAIERLSTAMPCVLVLEDLHWSDASTLDVMSFLARRREPARLMIVGTYRAEEVVGSSHPLALLPHDLAQRGWALDIPLQPLDESATAAYLARRLDGELPAGLARLLRRRTEGSPLFLVNAVDELLARGLLRRMDGAWRLDADPAGLELGIPAGMRALLEQQLSRLEAEDRQLLEAASASLTAFTPAAIAAALGSDEEGVEDRASSLARRRRFLRAAAGAPAGDRYEFIHALHREAVYERLPAGKRARLHARLAAHCERAYAAQAPEHAAELAFHFERAGQAERALPHLLQAAGIAARRFAAHETLVHTGRGLALLAAIGDSAQRREIELGLQVLRGTALMATRGYGDDEVERAFRRALELCDAADDGPEAFRVTAGLFGYRLIRCELAAAQELAGTLLRLGGATPHLHAEACWCAGVVALNRGDFTLAHEHLRAGFDAGSEASPELARSVFDRDSAATCASFDAWALWSLGRADEALARAAQAERRARELGDPQALAFALFFTAFVHQLRREPRQTRERCDGLIALAQGEGFAQWLAFGRILRGWAVAVEGEAAAGAEEIRSGLAAYRAAGAAVSVPHFLGLYAEALAGMGRVEEAREAVRAALGESAATGGRYYDGQLLRLQEELAGAEPRVGAGPEGQLRPGSPSTGGRASRRRADAEPSS